MGIPCFGFSQVFRGKPCSGKGISRINGAKARNKLAAVPACLNRT
jgi:hypothetical protein